MEWFIPQKALRTISFPGLHQQALPGQERHDWRGPSFKNVKKQIKYSKKGNTKA